MKSFYQITSMILIISQGCNSPKESLNQFSSSTDTLVIRTEKQKGDGLFLLGASPLDFKDTTHEFPYSVIYPKNITEVKRTQRPTELKAKEAHYIDIMDGIQGEKKIFIVDANNNKDFTDDSV